MEAKFNSAKIRLIIGLGNPDKEYENTYHNAGFLFADYLKKQKPAMSVSKSDASMNLSGAFVRKVLQKRGVKPEEFILVHDDSDLALGKYKIGFGRGSAGHKGVESVIKALRTKNFWRVRIGIRDAKPREILRETTRKKADLPRRPLRPRSEARVKAGDFVLNKISATNKKTLEAAFEEISRRLASI
ncbi:MAG: aminoacyl-tRNA hydrolase [Candidatus Jorgensenbacteria bacterium]